MLQSLQSAFTTLVGYIPQFLGALVVLVVGWIIAKVLKSVITKLLGKARVDERLTHGKGGEYVHRFSPQGSPALLLGTVVYAVIMLFVVLVAVSTLGIPTLSAFVALVLAYLPNVIAALLIFLIGAGVAAAVGGLVHRTMGDTPTGRVARSAAPTLVMAIVVFMVLNQLQIAPVIVTTTYIALIAAIALGSALAFGLGGREAAADLINSGYRKAQDNAGSIRQDFAQGRQRAEADYQSYRSGGGFSGSGAEGPSASTTAMPAAGAASGYGASGAGSGYGAGESPYGSYGPASSVNTGATGRPGTPGAPGAAASGPSAYDTVREPRTGTAAGGQAQSPVAGETVVGETVVGETPSGETWGVSETVTSTSNRPTGGSGGTGTWTPDVSGTERPGGIHEAGGGTYGQGGSYGSGAGGRERGRSFDPRDEQVDTPPRGTPRI